MNNKFDNECVVKFQNNIRKITMYFNEKDGNLDMQMAVDPELKEDEEPDLCMLLASTLLNTLNGEVTKDDSNVKVYDGKD